LLLKSIDIADIAANDIAADLILLLKSELPDIAAKVYLT